MTPPDSHSTPNVWPQGVIGDVPHPEMTAQVVLRRKKTRAWGFSSDLTVKIDGERVGYIENGHTLTYAVKPGMHTIQVKVDFELFSKSDVLEFSVGEREAKVFICGTKDIAKLNNWIGKSDANVQLYADDGLQ